ncbi:uncharacterized protein TNCT_192201 [Trichonephila clavata]|uniref:Uncharacterized protein n=1 Tax=Trichonephila clavata TaxID=2740835 RepID=A0A8X6M0Y0_TRICU|nr:uncharacterized protein TNCT_192201 [Trichonephila clavata]
MEIDGRRQLGVTSSKALDWSKWRDQRCLLLLATETAGLATMPFFMELGERHRVFVLPLPKTVEELKVRICNTLASATAQMLLNIGHEMEYHLDVVRVTKRSHTEHPRRMFTKF